MAGELVSGSAGSSNPCSAQKFRKSGRNKPVKKEGTPFRIGYQTPFPRTRSTPSITCGPTSSKAIISSVSWAPTPAGRNGNDSILSTIISRQLLTCDLKRRTVDVTFYSAQNSGLPTPALEASETPEQSHLIDLAREVPIELATNVDGLRH